MECILCVAQLTCAYCVGSKPRDQSPSLNQHMLVESRSGLQSALNVQDEQHTLHTAARNVWITRHVLHFGPRISAQQRQQKLPCSASLSPRKVLQLQPVCGGLCVGTLRRRFFAVVAFGPDTSECACAVQVISLHRQAYISKLFPQFLQSSIWYFKPGYSRTTAAACVSLFSFRR